MDEEDRKTNLYLWGFNYYSNKHTLIAITFFIILVTSLMFYYTVVDIIIMKGFLPLVIIDILLIICWIYVFSKWKKKKM